MTKKTMIRIFLVATAGIVMYLALGAVDPKECQTGNNLPSYCAE